MRTLGIFLLTLLTACSDSASLRVGATTTLDDSGLLQVIAKDFEQETGIKLQTVTTGSGQLFDAIKRGDITIAITHEPKGEQLLLDQGIIDDRTPLFYNHFLLVGPKDDPASAQQAGSIEAAFSHIQSRGYVFVSRGDNSGTHRQEQSIWQRLDNPVLSKTQFISTGSGMGATLSVAIERQAYTLVDAGTWLNFANKQEHKIVWGQDKSLLNPYHLLIVKPASDKRALLFSSWLQNPNTLAKIKAYTINNEPLFSLFLDSTP